MKYALYSQLKDSDTPTKERMKISASIKSAMHAIKIAASAPPASVTRSIAQIVLCTIFDIADSFPLWTISPTSSLFPYVLTVGCDDRPRLGNPLDEVRPHTFGKFCDLRPCRVIRLR